MKKLMTIFLLVTCLIGVKARNYNTCIGLRGGRFGGIAVKHFIGGNKANEGIVTTRLSGFIITGLCEINIYAFGVDRLNWYCGGGGHVGFCEGKYVKWSAKNRHYTVIGIDGNLGLAYNFKEIPKNLSPDWKPALNMISYHGFCGDGGAFSVRFIL